MNLKPGEELNLRRYVYNFAGDYDISDLVQLPINKLAELEEASVAAEKAIGEQVYAKVGEWEQQAKQTVRIRQAKQYLRTMSVSHTSNQWTEDRYGRHELSNMVYQFSWRINERTTWDRTAQKSVVTAWELSWSLMFNTAQNSDQTSGRQIAGQSRKVFKEKAAMEKYLQGRIATYAHLFTEISPPIPKENQKCFCINGVLLPGYTVENPDALKPDEAALDDLLSLLDADEIGDETPAPPPEPQPEEKSPQKIWEKHRKQRLGSSQRKLSPAR